MAINIDYSNYLIYDPEGKIKQLDYAKKSSELGNISIALTNGKFGILISHTPQRSILAEKQQKVFEINSKTLFTFSGITNDGLSIVRYLKNQSVFEDVIKDRPLHHLSCFEKICTDAAMQTLTGANRIYGVMGILMTDYDGVKVVEFEPTGYVREVIGGCVGSNSQSCRTILEDEADSIPGSTLKELVELGLRALKNAFIDTDSNILKPENIEIYSIEAGKGINIVDDF